MFDKGSYAADLGSLAVMASRVLIARMLYRSANRSCADAIVRLPCFPAFFAVDVARGSFEKSAR